MKLNIQTQGCKDLRERVHWFQRDEQTRANHKRGEGRPVRGSSERLGHRQDGRWPHEEPVLKKGGIISVCKRNKCIKFCWSRRLVFYNLSLLAWVERVLAVLVARLYTKGGVLALGSLSMANSNGWKYSSKFVLGSISCRNTHTLTDSWIKQWKYC